MVRIMGILVALFLSMVFVASAVAGSVDLSLASVYWLAEYRGGRLKLKDMSGVSVASGSRGAYPFSVIRLNDGSVMTTGCNTWGQLGDGKNETRYYPEKVITSSGGYLDNVISVAAGYGHALALKSDGTVWAWGKNDNGQLGLGDTTNRNRAVQVPGLNNVVAIAAGSDHSLAVRSDGMVFAWGRNAYGQLGDGTTQQRNTPVVASSFPYSEFAIDVKAGWGFSLVLASSGRVYGCGDNRDGELGRGNTSTYNTTYQPVLNGFSGAFDDVVAIGAGGMHSLFLRSDGTVWGCGSNYYGQLGQGTTGGIRTYPVQVKSPDGGGYLSNIKEIGSGKDSSFAVKFDGTVWSWGYNSAGYLGDGTNINRNLPVQVKGPGGVEFLSNVERVFVGSESSVIFALDRSGRLWCWSGASYAATMLNSYSNTPVRAFTGYAVIRIDIIKDLQGISINASNSVRYQISRDGTNWFWRNSYGSWVNTCDDSDS